jgi:dTDP-4-amino-4,6-dideoxygalactose transaminase
MSFYKNKYRYNADSYAAAATISDGIIALPVGPHLNEKDMVFIADQLKNILKELNV